MCLGSAPVKAWSVVCLHFGETHKLIHLSPRDPVLKAPGLGGQKAGWGTAGRLVPLLPGPHLHLTLQLLRPPLQEASPLRAAHWHRPASGAASASGYGFRWVRSPGRGRQGHGMGSRGPKSQGLGSGAA